MATFRTPAELTAFHEPRVFICIVCLGVFARLTSIVIVRGFVVVQNPYLGRSEIIHSSVTVRMLLVRVTTLKMLSRPPFALHFLPCCIVSMMMYPFYISVAILCHFFSIQIIERFFSFRSLFFLDKKFSLASSRF